MTNDYTVIFLIDMNILNHLTVLYNISQNTAWFCFRKWYFHVAVVENAHCAFITFFFFFSFLEEKHKRSKNFVYCNFPFLQFFSILLKRFLFVVHFSSTKWLRLRYSIQILFSICWRRERERQRERNKKLKKELNKKNNV